MCLSTRESIPGEIAEFLDGKVLSGFKTVFVSKKHTKYPWAISPTAVVGAGTVSLFGGEY